MKDLLPDLRRWLARGDSVALAVVTATRRSAPRPVGSVLAVSSSGELAGSVSGGCVESEVYGEAREVLGGAPARQCTFGISDEAALTVGLPCGGEIDVFVASAEAGLLDRAMQEIEAGRVVTVEPAGEGLELVSKPPPRLLVVGAVDTAEALCRGARALGWRTIVADPRARFATAERLPSADEILLLWPDEALEQVAPDEGTAVVVLAHEDRFDLPALAGALASDAFYIGAIGSRRTQASRREKLLAQGVAEDALDRIHGPAGLDLGAQSPAETALSILAEILAVRSGREGGTLRGSTGRIHATA
jgi:xanthine dehydrogenase accessory factor